MKHLYKTIARFLFVALSLMGGVGGGLTSCEHPISIINIECESELVVYAFPSTDDEYLLSVSLSQPTAGRIGKLELTSVECITNPSTGSGQARADDVTFLRQETHFGMPMAIYRVKGQHRSGDKVSISIKDAEGRSAAASTTIPATTPMEVTHIDTVYTANSGTQIQFMEHFTPSAAQAKETAYFATRLTSVWDTGDDNDYSDYLNDANEIFHDNSWYSNYMRVQYIHLSIIPSYEPLLNHYDDLDLDAWNEYYEHMYFLSTDDIRRSSQAEGLTHGGIDLHLHVSDNALWRQVQYIDVQFYTLSPEYYLMLRHINDQRSNEMAEVGLSQTFSTYSNVRGGLGCVAAYACSHYKYVPPVIESDGMYY